MVSRRGVFALGGSLFLTVAAGCQSNLDLDPAPIDLKFYNYTNRVQPLKLELLRTGNHTHDAAAVVDRNFEVPQPEDGESAGTLRKPGIAKRQAYVARVKLKYGDGTWAHHHFYPDDAEYNEVGIRIYAREQSDRLYVRFQ